MAHSTGFEPVTARFVAEYSIQLSYECVLWRRTGDSNPRHPFEVYSLSRGAPSATRPALRNKARMIIASPAACKNFLNSTACQPLRNQSGRKQKAHAFRHGLSLYGALDRIRTCDRSVRSRVLYPAELRVRMEVLYQTYRWLYQITQHSYGLPMTAKDLEMAHSTGFEPVTARFVAEYSIQLSYECVFGCCAF